MRRIIGLIGAVIAVWIFLQGTQGRNAPATRARPTPPSPSATAPAQDRPSIPEAATSSPAGQRVGFRSPARLAEHYAKHGAEFGRVSEAEYLSLAQALRDAAVGDNVLEVVRSSDGVISRFDRTSGAFLAADADGTIRTFFKPNDGEAYFRRQARRRPSP